MNPSPPVTTHRRPVNGVDRHGIQSAVSVLSARFTPRDPRRRSPRPAPRRRPTATSRAPTRCRHTAPRRPARPGRPVRRSRGTRSARGRHAPGKAAGELVLDRLERPRVVDVVEHVEVAGAQRPRAHVGVGRRWAVHEATADPAPACGFPVDGVEVVVEHQRTPAATIDDTPTRPTASTSAPCSPVMIVRRSAQRGPMPLQNVVSSTGSWYQGGRTISRSVERTTQTPLPSESPASSASSVATSCR